MPPPPTASQTRPRLAPQAELTSRVPYAKSYAAKHGVLNRTLELRMLVEGADERAQQIFGWEATTFLVMDHPAFPPVYERGMHQGRPFYAIPGRRDKKLSDLVQAPDFSMGERCTMVRRLAAGLAAAHRRGVLMGRIRPEHVAWNREAGHAYFLHSPGPKATGIDSVLPEVPEAVAARPMDERGRDVFHWGFLAYWVLASGVRPYGGESDSVLFPLSSFCADVHGDLAGVIQACLGEDPELRPAHGLELHVVLEERRRDLRDPMERPPDEEADKVSQSIKASIRKHREELIEELPTAQNQLADLVALTEGLEDVASSFRGSGWKTGALIGLAITVLLLALSTCSFDSGPPPPTTGGTGPIVDGAASRVDPAYQDDPYIQHLLSVDRVTPRNFGQVWTLIHNLSLNGRLPPSLDDPEQIAAIKAAFKKDRETASLQLEGFLARFKQALTGG